MYLLFYIIHGRQLCGVVAQPTQPAAGNVDVGAWLRGGQPLVKKR